MTLDDGTTIKGKVRLEDILSFQKNNNRTAFRRINQSPPPSPRNKQLKSAIAFDIDVKRKGYLKVKVPKDVKEGEPFTIAIPHLKQELRCICPPSARFEKNSRILFLRTVAPPWI